MRKSELRKAKQGMESNAGSIEKELTELKKMQNSIGRSDANTITVTCGKWLTIACC